MITPEQALAIHRAGPEEVVKVICELSRQVDLQQRQIESLQKTVAEQKRAVEKLSKNSANSSKPPLSDTTGSNKTQKRNKGKGKIGAHPAFSEEEIQHFHDYRLDACPECGNADVTFMNQPLRVLQQMEIEKILVFKEEHRSYPVWCEHCQKIHSHSFLPRKWSKRDSSRSGSLRWWPP